MEKRRETLGPSAAPSGFPLQCFFPETSAPRRDHLPFVLTAGHRQLPAKKHFHFNPSRAPVRSDIPKDTSRLARPSPRLRALPGTHSLFTFRRLFFNFGCWHVFVTSRRRFRSLRNDAFCWEREKEGGGHGGVCFLEDTQTARRSLPHTHRRRLFSPFCPCMQYTIPPVTTGIRRSATNAPKTI